MPTLLTKASKHILQLASIHGVAAVRELEAFAGDRGQAACIATVQNGLYDTPADRVKHESHAALEVRQGIGRFNDAPEPLREVQVGTGVEDGQWAGAKVGLGAAQNVLCRPQLGLQRRNKCSSVIVACPGPSKIEGKWIHLRGGGREKEGGKPGARWSGSGRPPGRQASPQAQEEE